MQLRPAGRFDSIEHVVQKTGLRRDELTTLADIGALNAFTNGRRSALWQVERAVRPAGELLQPAEDNAQLPTPNSQTESRFTTHDSRLDRSPESVAAVHCHRWTITIASERTMPGPA